MCIKYILIVWFCASLKFCLSGKTNHFNWRLSYGTDVSQPPWKVSNPSVKVILKVNGKFINRESPTSLSPTEYQYNLNDKLDFSCYGQNVPAIQTKQMKHYIYLNHIMWNGVDEAVKPKQNDITTTRFNYIIHATRFDSESTVKCVVSKINPEPEIVIAESYLKLIMKSDENHQDSEHDMIGNNESDKMNITCNETQTYQATMNDGRYNLIKVDNTVLQSDSIYYCKFLKFNWVNNNGQNFYRNFIRIYYHAPASLSTYGGPSAIVAISIGFGLLVCAAVLCLILYYKKKKKQNIGRASVSNQVIYADLELPETPDVPLNRQEPPYAQIVGILKSQ